MLDLREFAWIYNNNNNNMIMMMMVMIMIIDLGMQVVCNDFGLIHELRQVCFLVHGVYMFVFSF